MVIEKVLNNNVAISKNEKGHDVIVMGSGIAFQKKRGDVIDSNKIERVFEQKDNVLMNKISKALEEIPSEYLEISETLITHAKESLKYDMNENLYLSLMDHIYFTIQRYQSGLLITNQLLVEIKMLYKKEYEEALYALKEIDEKFGVNLPEDEAGFIALHYVNASMDNAMDTTIKQTKIVNDALMIVKNTLKIELAEDSLQYYRLVTHLKFFAQRILTNKLQPSSEEDEQLLEVVKHNYKIAYECVDRICQYFQISYGVKIPVNEYLYLTLHIERIRKIND